METNQNNGGLSEPETWNYQPVESYFDRESAAWNEIYERQDVYALIHQDRRATALRFIDELNLPLDAKILEIGCGAGLTSIDIARRGYTVRAVDSSQEMVQLALRNALRHGLASQISVEQADIYHLDFEDHSFDLIVVLGVIPWLPDIQPAVAEITRLVRKGGYVVVNIDNRYRLNHLLDPAHNPIFSNLKRKVKNWAARAGVVKPAAAPPVRMYSVKEFEGVLSQFGYKLLKKRMLGFGPFQFMRIDLFNAETGVKLYRFLQRLADQGNPLLRQAGSQYLVLVMDQS